MDVEHLIDYLDTGLNMDTLREMDREDLYRLREMLHHWERLADMAYSERRNSSKEEKPE